ncbi:saccharopine dehydrogenase C-terminal domain-containing protein [Puniceibacterium sp. IMCC21224]|uniref:saccharopine dehydrogenase C-terminal domain-containing protein n=1 Tax=Puniceibacterium sp. IMCC21224 TaxID=1618204 RepID=UPI00064DE629|nr:saccharopine dehydrogenase C-terminal domain-containing protein [Puniceibacterium sp. IMCC21224]KMK68712.1 Saccharopine dehydrogenase [Puniceibacterium sp. IMCC21224]
MTIHWCGTGPLAVPGLRRLIIAGHEVTVWSCSLDQAEDAIGALTQRIHEYEPDALGTELQPGDVLVSLLPAAHHAALAELALTRGAHFICASYLTPELRRLHAQAQLKGVCLMAEVGLTPGVDHLLAHALVAGYRASADYDASNLLSFSSWCGILPRYSNAFRHKFRGQAQSELDALRTPSRSIRQFTSLDMTRPWEALTRYSAPLPQPETFEVFPSGDSLPYLDTYAFDPTWKVRNFARGTLRLSGWADAWNEVLARITTLDQTTDDDLRDLSQALTRDHSFAPEEPDRVVLCVSLLAEAEGRAVWHQTYVIDAWGDTRGPAEARLVSTLVSLAAEAVMARQIAPGISAAPADPRLVIRWLDVVDSQAQHMMLNNHIT